ncbi:MAG: histidine phosphatase family protein [Oscillospiraceae bacterium]|nr:histidine phosphatase family protein [Oscillospiraceae bacterium]
MKIYVLRHGETDLNKENKMQCQVDSVINETGVHQAREARKKLENIEYDFVISSPLLRAKETAEIANNNKKPLILDDRLRERNSGILDGRSHEEIDLEEFFDYHKNVNYEGAENMQALCTRIWDFLDDIKKKYHDKTILLVTHNIVIRAIRAYISGIPEDGNLRRLGIQNGEVVEWIL